jgi:hypothetical protein
LLFRLSDVYRQVDGVNLTGILELGVFYKPENPPARMIRGVT